MKKLLTRLGVLLAVSVMLDQVALRVLLRGNSFLGNPVAPFDPPLFAPSQVEKLERIRESLAAHGQPTQWQKFDADLGWCNPPDSGFDEFRYDWAGCRIGVEPLARVKPTGTQRVVLVGCSMTHGDEVGARESWAAQLDAAVEGLEVANLGVSAYGPDQALMRLERDGLRLEPDEVWLCLLPESILRATTLYRPILRHWSLDVAFKPRFALQSDGSLRFVPNPPRTLADIPRLLSDQRALLAAFDGQDPWVERWPAAYAPRGSHWSHHSFAGRLVLSLLEAGDREVAPWVAAPEGEVFRLMLAMFERAQVATASVGARLRIVILPGRGDLTAARPGGRPYWGPLTEAALHRGLEVVDLTEILDAEGARLDLDALYAPHGHYNPRGSALVAGFLGAAFSQDR